LRRVELRGRRTRVRLASFGLALLSALGGLAFMGFRRAEDYRRALEYSYQCALGELAADINGIDAALQKGMYSSSPSLLAAAAVRVSRQAAAARRALSVLPQSLEALNAAALFLAQADDYGCALSQRLAAGDAPDEEIYQTLKGLSQTAGRLARELTALQGVVYEEHLPIAPPDEGERPSSQPALPAWDSLSPQGEAVFSRDIFPAADERPADPDLAAFLADKPDITRAEAAQKAAVLLGLAEGILTFDGEGIGVIPVYRFSGRLDGGEVALTLSRRGGFPVALVSSRQSGEAKFSVEQAETIAKNFLLAQGFDSMKRQNVAVVGNTAVFDFAHRQGDVTCLSDRVQISVALDTGKVVGLEASDYLTNHQSRAILPPQWDQASARAVLSPRLTPQVHELALLRPDDGGPESLCHKFTCAAPDGRRLIVYINADTGREEQILLLIETETGTMYL
jgi:germination protein YpeB